MCFPRGSVAFWATECLTPQIDVPCQVLVISRAFNPNPPIRVLRDHGHRPRLTTSDYLSLLTETSLAWWCSYSCVEWGQHSPFPGTAHVAQRHLTRDAVPASDCMDCLLRGDGLSSHLSAAHTALYAMPFVTEDYSSTCGATSSSRDGGTRTPSFLLPKQAD